MRTPAWRWRLVAGDPVVRILIPLLLIVPAAAAAQQAPSGAAAAADRFSLELPQDDAVTAPEPAPRDATPTAMPTTSPGHFSLDTPIADLVADPRAKAVLDRDLPGLSGDENLPKFRTLSLRKLAPLSGGQLTGELLTKVAYDLAAIDAGEVPAKARPKPTRALPNGR